MQKDFFALTSLSPLDGRYSSKLSKLSEYFSEFALIKYRVQVEVAYLLFLSEQKLIPSLSASAKKKIAKIAADFSLEQAMEVKDIEKKTMHDVKAVEYFIRQQLEKLSVPIAQYVHIGMTSEDTNSLAQSLMLKEARDQYVLPKLNQVLKELARLAVELKDATFLARTHGQVAVPTTMGKELMVFALRLCEELQILSKLAIDAKLSGAVGNFSAQLAAFPEANWPKLSQKFITSLGLKPALISTQIVSAESYSRLFSSLLHSNLILLDLDQDIWRYISDGLFAQQKAKGQVGSSTMPHKVNPIDFENSEGNLGLANSLLSFFVNKLPISRLQRDLSDSTVKRNFGTALGYACLGYDSLLKGLGKIKFNLNTAQQELNEHWEVIGEAFQVILRVNGDEQGYEKLKDFSQGKKITATEINDFIDTLSVSAKVKKQLRAITPNTYTGLAAKLVDQSLVIINSYLKGQNEQS